MRLTVFRAGKGDCLLLSNTGNTTRMLVDGGVPAAYRAHVAPTLGRLRAARRRLDLVYVSHIDDDHIGGVLEMLDDEVDWRVHEYQLEHGNRAHEPPAAPRPPQVRAIWHNAFHEQLPENAGEIEDALAAIAPVLSGADVPALREAGLQQAQIATGVRQAIQVSRRIGPKQLRIPLNEPAGGRLMMRRREQPPIDLGGMQVTILGPTTAHLKRLRSEWNAWLEKNTRTLEGIRETSARDQRRLGASDFDRLLQTLRLQAEAFGSPSSVTPPNLASLTLLVEQDDRSVLLTGDARGDQIVEGLRDVGRLTDRTFRVDVLKVPHHGSEHNIDSDFCDTVIARHYVFCGNGEHSNPDLRVVEMMARRRLAADGPFKFWFNSSSAVSEREAAAAHMREVETIVRRAAKASKRRMSFKFLEKGDSLEVI